MQHYKCRKCGKQFQSKRRNIITGKRIWEKYVWGKQTVRQLAQEYKKSSKWIHKQINSVEIKTKTIEPQPVAVILDTTFFGREYGITVFRSQRLKKNLWWEETRREAPQVYAEGKNALKQRGFKIQAAVIDGKRGILGVFYDVPVQMCQFHQSQIITRYLTRRPRMEAGKELRSVALALTKSGEKDFAEKLNAWHKKWKNFLKEKTTDPETGKWFFTHRRLRSAHRSLKTNLPYLFTYQKYPELNIPNTTNSLDGSFSHLKDLLRIHRGLKKERRRKLINEILGK